MQISFFLSVECHSNFETVRTSFFRSLMMNTIRRSSGHFLTFFFRLQLLLIMMMLGPSLILASFSDSPFLLASLVGGLSTLASLSGSLCMVASHFGGLCFMASLEASLDGWFFGFSSVMIIAM